MLYKYLIHSESLASSNFNCLLFKFKLGYLCYLLFPSMKMKWNLLYSKLATSIKWKWQSIMVLMVIWVLQASNNTVMLIIVWMSVFTSSIFWDNARRHSLPFMQDQKIGFPLHFTIIPPSLHCNRFKTQALSEVHCSDNHLWLWTMS